VANHTDAIKRNRQSEERRERNRHFRSRMRNQIKKLRAAIDAGDKDTAQSEFRAATSIIQRLATKGVMHRNQAARRVKRLHKAVAAL